MTTHHADCDGYRFAHRAEVRRVSPEGHGMWQAVALECCDYAGTLVGPGALDLAKREANAHMVETACEGECASW